MRTFRSFISVCSASLLLAAGAALPAEAAITQTVNYQGFLLSKLTNLPVETAESVKFLIFPSQSGGSALFSEDRCGANAVNVLKGRYDVEIGSVTSGGIPDNVFIDNQNLWLEIQVAPTGSCGGTYEAMTPRIRLQASPFAFNSLYASTAAAATPVFAVDVIGAQAQTTYGAVTISTNLFVQGGISVGNISPGQKLSVAGVVESKGTWPDCAADPSNYTCGFKFPDGSIQETAAANTMWAVDGISLYSINPGNVAIGESNNVPLARLHVSSGAGSTSDLLMLSTGTTAMFRVNGLGQVYGGTYYGNGSALAGVVISTGSTMTGPLTLNGSSFTVTAAAGITSPKIRFLSNVGISSTTAGFGGGVYVSTNIFVVGYSSAAKYYGDGSGLTGVLTSDSSKVLKVGDTMTGPLTLYNSTLTVTGAAFSVTGSNFSVFGGSVAIGGSTYPNTLSVTGGVMATSSITAQGGLYSGSGVSGGAAVFQTVMASTASFFGTAPGANNYTIDTASGIKVNAGIISAPYFVGDGSRLLNVSGTDANRVLRSGDTMTGNLTISGSSLTVTASGAQAYALTVASAAAVNNYSLAVTTGGSVGVLVSNPAAALDVNGKIMVSNVAGGDSTLQLNSNGGYSTLRWSDYSLAATGNVSQGAMGYLPNLTRDFAFRALGSSPANGGSEVYRINTQFGDNTTGASWRFGIGTSAPAEKFHVAANVLVSTSDFTSPILYISTTTGDVSIGTAGQLAGLTVGGGIVAVSSITAQGGFFGDASGLTNFKTGGLPDLISVSSIAARDTSTYGALVLTSNTYVNANLAVGEIFTPGTPLHVHGVLTLDQKESEGFTNLNFALHNGGPAFINWSEGAIGSKGSLGMPSNQRDLVYNTPSDEVFRIKGYASGTHGWQFGIGTNNPQASFNVAADMLVSDPVFDPILFVSTKQAAVGIWTNAPAERFNVASTMLVGSKVSPLIYASTGTGNVGIGTISPQATLEVSGNLLGSGTDGTPTPPVTGAGTRFMWIPSGAAIRAGKVPGAEWDTIGLYSVAFGYRGTASAQASVVGGGYNNSAIASYATVAGGLSNDVEGQSGAVGGGETNLVYGRASVIPGGRYNVIHSTYAFSGGYNNYVDAGADGTFVWGYDDSHSTGIFNTFKVTAQYAFLVDPANIKHYDVGIRTAAPAAALDVNGDAQFGASGTRSGFSSAGFWQPRWMTSANIQLATPDALGEVVGNSDITDLCISTGTSQGNWALVGSKGTKGCY